MIFVKLFIIVSVIGFAISKTPEFFHTCKRSDPNLNDCALNSGKAIMSNIMNGFKEFRIPVLDPLKLEKVELAPGAGFKLVMTKLVATGIRDAELQKVTIDPKTTDMHVELLIPRIEIVMEYDINGRILVLPITGHGPGNVTMVNMKFIYDASVGTKQKKGKEYFTVPDPHFTYTLQRMYIDLKNLFNGDPALGPQMSSFLDENWEEVSKEISPAIGQTINVLLTTVFTGVFNAIPASELVLQ